MSMFVNLVNQAFALSIHGVMLSNVLRDQDFKTSLGFYGAYHQDPVNQAIHFVCVPIILWTAIIWFAYDNILEVKMSFLGHRITWSTLTFLIYIVYYNTLDPFGGRIFSVVVVAMYISAYRMVAKEKTRKMKAGANAKAVSGNNGLTIWQIAGLVHIFSWYLQIHPGHMVYEGVKPALFDSLSQALTVAPLFAFYEGIFYMGLAPELQQEVLSAVNQERTRICATGADFPFCN